MRAEHLTTHVTPQKDGALLVAAPDEQTQYDTGNRQLFVTFDGHGGVPRILLTEGYSVGAWQFECRLDGTPFGFSQARGIGRLWELQGAASGVEIELDSFLEETTAVVFQNCTISNRTPERHTLELTLTLDIGAPFTAQQQQESAAAMARVQQPGPATSGGRELAKVACPV